MKRLLSRDKYLQKVIKNTLNLQYHWNDPKYICPMCRKGKMTIDEISYKLNKTKHKSNKLPEFTYVYRCNRCHKTEELSVKLKLPSKEKI